LASSLAATSTNTSDYAVTTLGQLKTVAKPVYDRLLSIDYYGPALTSGTYPWIGNTASDFSVANIGQTKNLFSFDLTYSSDGNALPNWWRMYYFQTLSISSTSTVMISGTNFTYLQAYQQQLNPLPPPVFSPSAGSVAWSTPVTISAPGSTTIYFTTNGSDPATNGSLYTGPISVIKSATLKAIAYNQNAATPEGSAAYSVGGNFPALAAGANYSLALRSDGTLWAWGADSYGSAISGQLGIGNAPDQWYPVQVSSSTSVIGIAAGTYHSLAVTTDGRVWAWGRNTYGQLGISGTVNNPNFVNTPQLVIGGTNVVAVAAGAYHSVALTSGSAVLAWGDNDGGQLGINSQNNQPTPVQVSGSSGLAGVTAIAAGAHFTMALTSGSSVWVWGDNTWDQCCQGSSDYGFYSVPIEVINSQITNIVAIAAGDNHALALQSNGMVWTWGDNQYGELGGGNSIPLDSSAPVQVLTSTGTLTGVVSIAAGPGFSIAVKNDGTVWSWGELGDSGLLGSGSNNVATQLIGVSGAVFAAASYHALIAGTYGSVMAEGQNSNGELGVGICTSSTTPLLSTALLVPQPPQPAFSPDSGFYTGAQNVTVSCTNGTIFYTTDGSTPGPTNGSVIASGSQVAIMGPTILRAVAVTGNISGPIKSAAYHMGYQMITGGEQSVLLDTNGTVYTWGANTDVGIGLLGLGWIGDDQVLPQLVAGLSGSASAIAASAATTGAVVNSGTNLGTVWMWGDNSDHECLPASSTFSFYTPVQVPGITGATSLSCDWTHTAAVTGSGTVLSWGDNTDGELGNGTTDSETAPVTVSGLSGVASVATGPYYTLALLSNGTVYAWGYNVYGQLGNNSTSNSSSPVQVQGLNNIIAIAASNSSNFALRSDGTVWAWGLDDGYDSLADNLAKNEVAPVLVGTIRDVAAISAGNDHNLALLGNGTIMAWGANENDSIANTATNPSLPTPEPSFSLTEGTNSIPSIVTMVSAGDFHTLAVLNTSGVQTLWGWGYNGNGQLGNGSLNSSYTPTMVQFFGYASNQGYPDWLALTQGLDPFVPYSNSTGIPINILYDDGLGLNPTIPYTPYQLPTTGGGTAPTIYVNIPAGATLY
jgi:alpha-tubulin suppressor-like RCC1 family protein